MRLINADKLKEEVKKIAEEEKKENAMWACGLRYALKIIDKAQTVEHSLLPLSGEADNAYMRGYEVGKAEGILKAETRPKGEWEEGTQGYYCSKCDYYDQSYFEHNYCPNCGAEMQCAEEEQ